jgi:hypothetical protein
MTPSVSRRAVAGTLAVICLVAGLTVRLHAQEEVYKKGLEAWKEGKWAEAAKAMQTAIAAERNESATKKVKIGVRFGLVGGTEYPYLPHYFLGEALMGQKNCVSAIAAFAESERQGVVNGDNLTNIRKHYKACLAEGVLPPTEYQAASDRASKKYADATALYKRVAALASANPTAVAGSDDALENARKTLEASHKSFLQASDSRRQTDFTEASTASDRSVAVLGKLELGINAAVKTLSDARQQFRDFDQLLSAAASANQAIDDTGYVLTGPLAATRKKALSDVTQARDSVTGSPSPNPAKVKEAAELVRSATGVLIDLGTQARQLADRLKNQRFTEARRATVGALSLVEGSLATLQRRMAQEANPIAPEISGEHDKLQAEFTSLKRRFDRASKLSDMAAMTQTAQLALNVKGRVETVTLSFGPLTLRDRGLPAALEEGAGLFFRGDYQQALSTLDAAGNAADAPLQLHVHLFRAAARYALYVRGGETDKAMLDQVRAEIARSKQIDSAFKPDTRAFAPRFLALYHDNGVSSPKP